jgi:AraC-like DNA-binding protein
MKGRSLWDSRGQGYALQHEGASDFIAVRFRPGGLAAFLPVPLAEVTDRIVDVRDLWGREIRFLHEQLYDASLPTAFRLIREFLQRQYAPPNHYSTIQHALHQIHQRRGQMRMGPLANDLNMSQKHLERLFQRYVGHAPKSYARIVRFQGVLQAFTSPAAVDVVGLAHQLGYFDQAHLINDFKDFTGLTPGQYQATKSSVIETYYGS